MAPSKRKAANGLPIYFLLRLPRDVLEVQRLLVVVQVVGLVDELDRLVRVLAVDLVTRPLDVSVDNHLHAAFGQSRISGVIRGLVIGIVLHVQIVKVRQLSGPSLAIRVLEQLKWLEC